VALAVVVVEVVVAAALFIHSLLNQQHCQQLRLSRISGVLNELEVTSKQLKPISSNILAWDEKIHRVVLTWYLSWVSKPVKMSQAQLSVK